MYQSWKDFSTRFRIYSSGAEYRTDFDREPCQPNTIDYDLKILERYFITGSPDPKKPVFFISYLLNDKEALAFAETLPVTMKKRFFNAMIKVVVMKKRFYNPCRQIYEEEYNKNKKIRDEYETNSNGGEFRKNELDKMKTLTKSLPELINEYKEKLENLKPKKTNDKRKRMMWQYKILLQIFEDFPLRGFELFYMRINDDEKDNFIDPAKNTLTVRKYKKAAQKHYGTQVFNLKPETVQSIVEFIEWRNKTFEITDDEIKDMVFLRYPTNKPHSNSCEITTMFQKATQSELGPRLLRKINASDPNDKFAQDLVERNRRQLHTQRTAEQYYNRPNSVIFTSKKRKREDEDPVAS